MGAILEGRPEAALTDAHTALRLSPINSGAMRSVAVIEDLRGDGVRSTELMNKAAALGWRDPIVQLWVIDRALRTGETATAVQRAEGLFQQRQFPPAAVALLLRAPNREASLNTLAALLGRQPSWRGRFMSAAAQAEPGDLPAIEELLKKVAGKPGGVTLDESEDLLDRLVEKGDFAAAQRIFALTRRGQFIANGDFEKVTSGSRGGSTPDHWTVSRGLTNGPQIGVAPAGGRGNALKISQSNGGQPVLAQQLILAPGPYTLSVRSHARNPAGLSLNWQIRCDDLRDQRRIETPLSRPDGWQEHRADFTVPIRDCPVQRLVLRVSRDIASNEIWIDDVRLTPTGPLTAR
jgi:N-acetylglutamate synthase-like GNAT family acetyltransferase